MTFFCFFVFVNTILFKILCFCKYYSKHVTREGVGRSNFTRSKVLNALFCIIKTFDLVPKSERTTLNTRSKVLKALLNFRSSAKKELATFFTRSKVLIMVFLALKTFDLVKIINKSFNLLPKNGIN